MRTHRAVFIMKSVASAASSIAADLSKLGLNFTKNVKVDRVKSANDSTLQTNACSINLSPIYYNSIKSKT